MSFLQNIFLKEKKGEESVILINIGADSVAGAYARYEKDALPALLYTRRLPIEIRKDEPHERAMRRALDILGNDLIREGAPVLTRATGSGAASMILVSVDAPWQETHVRSEDFESKEPFVFTKDLVTKRLEETTPSSSEKMITDESVISTTLNGYETKNPYGKKVHRASIVVLTSLIEQKIADGITATLRSLFHTIHILPIAGSSLRYQAMRTLFPHEEDAIILDATGGSVISVALVRKEVFVSLEQVQVSSKENAWIDAVRDEFVEIAKSYQLPRTVFLLAREPEIASLRKILEEAHFGSIWFSQNPPKVIPVVRSSMNTVIRQMTTSPADIVLLLMALFWKNRKSLSDEK